MLTSDSRRHPCSGAQQIIERSSSPLSSQKSKTVFWVWVLGQGGYCNVELEEINTKMYQIRSSRARVLGLCFAGLSA